MSLALYRVRRATVDDLPALLPMWEAGAHPTIELEKRLKEFQIIETDDGTLVGALGLETNGRHGRLHSETFADFALADTLREQLWARMQSVAENLGLARIWTCEAAPFWKKNGLLPANEETLKRLPAPWKTLDCDWLSLELRDESALQATLDKKFTQFETEERLRREETLRKAKTWKTVGIVLVFIVATAAIYLCIYLLLHRNALARH